MKKLLFAVTGCFLMAFCSITNPVVVKADEAVWYEDLPTASTAEELFGTHIFSTENNPTKIRLSKITEPNNNELLATPSQATRSQDSDIAILEELIASDTSVSIPYNGRSKFIDIIAKIDDDTYVNVTSVVDWESEDNGIAYAYNGRILARDEGITTVKASLANVNVLIDVVVEDYIDLEAEIERLNSLYPDSPGGVSTYAITHDERDAIISRGKEMLSVSWVPTQNLVGWRGNYTFLKGEKVIGIPYTQNKQKNAAGFLAVLSASDFYNTVTVNGKKMPQYGNDCSGFLSFAWDISRQTTYDFTQGIKNGTYAQVGSYSASTETPNQSDLKSSYNYLKRGDGLVCRIDNNGHALLVSVPDPQNELVHVYEQTPPQTTINTWTYQELAEGGYKPFTQSSTDGWYKINGYWYYYENDTEASGWKQIDGYWYYFLPESHRMATAWQQVGGVWYYLNPDSGAMHEGWLLYNNDWYYLKSGSGAMASNESLVIDGKTYHFNSSGVCTNP